MNKVNRSGAGRERDSWGIREWLAAQKLNMTKVARILEVHPTNVTRTVAGIDNNRKVLLYLKNIGCPLKSLSLPDDIR